MAEKAARVGSLGDRLSELLPRLGADSAAIRRAAALCKCDLATQMVGEFPELQGHVGRLYAAKQGEGEAVALAIEEHYLPRFSGDDVASSPAGRLLALAERLDTLVGCFGVGLEPRGGGDPQGLRRAAVGLLQTLLAMGEHVELGRLFTTAVEVFHAEARSRDGFEAWRQHRGDGTVATGGDAVVSALVDFALARWKASRVEAGVTADLVDAVIHAATPSGALVQLDTKLTALVELAGTPSFAPVLTTVKRLLNILGSERRVGPAVDPSDCPEAVERELLDLTRQVQDRVQWLGRELDFPGVFAAVNGLAPAVDRFFVGVMVNDPDPVVRARRVGILSEVAELFASVADFSRISTR
jgi:glycyl-tRNA synthetase beta chain